MTTTDFVNLWTNLDVSFLNCENNQCITLIHRFVSEVIGLQDPTILAQPIAADIWNNFSNVAGNQYFTQFVNTPTAIPNRGDIIIWDANSNVGIPEGHCSIFLNGDVNSFTSFDSNWPVGSQPHQQNHSDYTDVSGWLRSTSIDATQ